MKGKIPSLMPSQLNQRMPVHDPFIILTHKNKNIKKKEQTLHRSIQLDILVRKWSTVLLYFFFFFGRGGGIVRGGHGAPRPASGWIRTQDAVDARPTEWPLGSSLACALLYLLSTKKSILLILQSWLTLDIKGFFGTSPPYFFPVVVRWH